MAAQSISSHLPNALGASPAWTGGAVLLAGAAAAALFAQLEFVPWLRMWLTAFCLFLIFKSIAWKRSSTCRAAGPWRLAIWYLGWPGLDAAEFCTPQPISSRPSGCQWIAAALSTAGAAAVLWGGLRHLSGASPVLQGALGFAAIVGVLHFGAFHLLALAWRSLGCGTYPIMDNPIAAQSLSEFWGRRWNRAYQRISFDLYFRPHVARLGARGATLAAFLASGFLHELVISVPAEAGFGLPTAYFLLQGVGMLLERGAIPGQSGHFRVFVQKLLTIAFVVGPVGLLFPAPFCTRVIVPFLAAIGTGVIPR